MNNLLNAQYTFGFMTEEHTGYESLATKLFRLLKHPDEVHSIAGDCLIYQQVFEKSTPSKNTTKMSDDLSKSNPFYKVVNFILDYTTVQNEQAFLVGFKTKEKLTEDDLKYVYSDLLIPLLSHIDQHVHPTHQIFIKEHYINTVEKMIAPL